VVYQKGFKPILNRVGINEKYPEMVVEIGSHTDSRGNTQFNMNYGPESASNKNYFWNNKESLPNEFLARIWRDCPKNKMYS
jgi:hypothetical protein